MVCIPRIQVSSDPRAFQVTYESSVPVNFYAQFETEKLVLSALDRLV